MTQAKTGNTIDKRQDWLEKDDAAHQLCRDLREGVPAMRKAAAEYRYLKPMGGELEPIMTAEGAFSGTHALGAVNIAGASWTRYGARVEQSDLPNPWADSISDTARLPFRARIVLEGWDQELQGAEKGKEPFGWVRDIDGEGRSLDELAHTSFAHSLFEGIDFWFIDNDPRTFESKAARTAAKARPWIKRIGRSAIRQLVWEVQDGRPRLTYLSFDQPQMQRRFDDPNDWQDEGRDAIRVVRAGDAKAEKGTDEAKVSWELWVKDDKDEFTLTEKGFITPDNPKDELRDIPLVPLVAERCGPWRGRSPYLNTAWTQTAIWALNSEIRGVARDVAHSRWFETGKAMLEPGERGAKALNQESSNSRYGFSSADNAGLALIESTGQPLLSLRELIADKEAQIRRAHHDIETQKAVTTTATEISLQGVHANSSLEQWLIQHEASWYQALSIMALLAGHSQRGTVEIPHDFGLPSQGMERNHALFIAEKMTAANYWREAKRAGDVDEKEFDEVAEIAREKEERVSSERARERLEENTADALTTPDDDEDDEAEEVPQA